MQPPKNAWPDTEGSRGVLFFAQLMSEMLSPTTFESFRVYSLDTNARLDEALLLAEDVRRERVPRATLDPIVEELKWSVTKDSAAIKLAEREIESLTRTVSDKNTTLDAFSSHIRFIDRLIGNRYKETVQNQILESFDQANRKNDIRKLAGFYCSHLINLGYSRQHILEVVNSYFFTSDVQRIGRATLAKFFREFDGRRKRFIVHAAVSKDLGNYLKGLGFVIRDIAQLSTDQVGTLALNSNFGSTPSALEVSVDHFDPHVAMDFAYQILSAQRAISYLDPYGMKCDWGNTMHVTKLRAQNGVSITKQDFLSSRPNIQKVRPNIRAGTISSYAKSLIENFDTPSTERLLSSIRTAALARTSFNPENQIISLWSAIEVLLSEPDDKVRIVHYANLITPCIALRHARRQILAIYDGLILRYRHRLNRLLRQMPNFPNSHGQKAFSEMMLLPEHEALRVELCKILENNPLALHRVWKLHNDYKDTKCAHRTICDHANRVEWQIHRVYRARNQLVHSGRMPSYLESVILNIAEYYTAAIATIVNRAKREEERSDIDQTVAEIGIRYSILRNQFIGKVEPFQASHVAMLMDFPTAWNS